MDAQEPGGKVMAANGQRLDGDRRRAEELIEKPANVDCGGFGCGRGSGTPDPGQQLGDVQSAVGRDGRALPDSIAALAARVLGRSAFDPDTDFFEAGGSSIDAVAFAADLARELGSRSVWTTSSPMRRPAGSPSAISPSYGDSRPTASPWARDRFIAASNPFPDGLLTDSSGGASDPARVNVLSDAGTAAPRHRSTAAPDSGSAARARPVP